MNLPTIHRLSRPISRIHTAQYHSVPHLLRQNQNAQPISEPGPGDSSSADISLAHPKDPGNASTPSSPSTPTSSAHSPSTSTGNGASDSHAIPLNAPPQSGSKLPNPQQVRHQQYANPPFHTHLFFVALEKSFPTETARSLMRATRALLVDRIGRVNREALTNKDLESVRPQPIHGNKHSSYMAYSKLISSKQPSLSSEAK